MKKGSIMSDESRKKMSQAKLGKKGPWRSKEWRRNISLAKIINGKPSRLG